MTSFSSKPENNAHQRKNGVVHARLLAERGGSDPTATAGPRRRSAPPPE